MGLDKKLNEPLDHVIEQAMKQWLGFTIKELREDLSQKLQFHSLFIIEIKKKRYKEALKEFKREYCKRVIKLQRGNISAAAKLLGVERRTLYRYLADETLFLQEIREKMYKPSYVQLTEIKHVLEKTFEEYKPYLHPHRYEQLTHHLDEISQTIIFSLPQKILPLKEAVKLFERRYLREMLQEEPNKKKLAQRIGLSYERLIKKLKKIKGEQ